MSATTAQLTFAEMLEVNEREAGSIGSRLI